MVIDSVVTILQYYNSPIGWGANLFLTQGRVESIVDFAGDTIGESGSLLGAARTPGIFDSVVINSIYIGTLGVLPFCFMKKHSLLSILAVSLAVVACFMCQERAGLYLLLASTIFLVFKLSGKKINNIILVVVLAIGIIFLQDLSFSNLGRIGEVDFSGDTRHDIWDYFARFFSENWMWGGPNSFRAMTGKLAHNYFYNAFIFGGLMGGITVIILFFMIVARCLKNCLNRKALPENVVLSVALLSLMAQGLVHNTSLVTGDAIIFLLLPMVILSEKNKKANNDA